MAGQAVPRRRWSGAHVVVLAAAIVAAVANWLVLTSGMPSTTVLVAATALAAGQVVTAADLVVQQVEGRGDPLEALLTDRPPGPMVALTDVAAGEPLRASDLIERAAGSGTASRRMSLPVPVEHAVGGHVQRGDRVDVLAAGDSGVRLVATGLEVVDVVPLEDRGFGALGSFHLTVVVDARQALCLVAALASDEVHVVLATGAGEQPSPTCRPIA